MFESRSSLTNLDVSSWDTSSVTDMSMMFYCCSSLTSLDLSSWDTSNVGNVYLMFFNCSSLREVSIGEKTCVELPAPASEGASGRWLSSADGIAYRPSDIPTGVAATYTAQLAESEASDLNSLGGCTWTIEQDGVLVIAPLPGGMSGALCNMGDGKSPFSNHFDEAFSVRIDPGVKASGSLSHLFEGLSFVEAMDLSGLDASCATDASYLFSGCSSIEHLDFSGWDASSITNMSSMFYGCSKLKSLDISSFAAPFLEDVSLMLEGCVSLERISVSDDFDLSAVVVEPSSIEGWTGKWVNEAGSAFAPDEIPTGKKDTYRAQIGLNADMFTVDCSDSVYTGYEITKAVLSSKLLEGLDYDVSYSSNVYVGIASIDIVGTGRATGALHYDFNITKATPRYDAPAPVDAAYGQTLSDVALPEGFSWQDDPSTPVGDAGEHEFLAAFTPGDTSNYESVRDVPVKVRVTRAVDASMFSVDAAGLVYDGSAHEPAVSSAVVPEGSYSVGYRDNVNAGEATAVVSGSGFYSGSCELKFDIAKAKPEYDSPAPVEAAYGQTLSDVALPEGFSWRDDPSTPVGDAGEHEFLAAFTPGDTSNYETVRDVPVKVRVTRAVDASMFSVDAAGLVYDGSAHEPAVSSAVVPEGSYSVGYRDNVNAGEATAVVSGSGFYSGSCELKFDIAKAKPEYDSPAPVEAAYGQTLSDVALPEGFSWQDASGVVLGDRDEYRFLASYTPFDQDNYEIVRDIPVMVRIARCPVDASMFSLSNTDFVYDGSAHEPAVTSKVVPEDSYSVEYRDNIEAGEATVIVTGFAAYKGSCELKFAIAKATPEYEIPSGICGAYGEPLSSVQLPAGYSWQDAPDRPIDWYGDKTLYATYSPADSDNYEAVNAIPVSVFVRRNTVDVPSVESLVYSGEKQTPAITLDSNVEVVTNEGGVDAGSYCVEFALKTPEFDRWSDGSFANKIVTYSIDPLDIAEAEVSVGEAYLENGKSEPSVSVSIAGSSLVQSRDYVLAYENNDALGEGIVKIQGKGNYSGTREVPFTILKNPVIAKGSCGQGVTYKIYDSGLMTIDGNGGVSFDGDAPYAKYASSVKVLKVGRGVTSFCDYSFYPLKQCRAVFFMGSQTPGLYKYFSKNALTNFDQDRKCSYYHDPSNDTWENFEIGKTCKPWVDGMLDIDWSSMVEFGACGDESFWVLSNDGTLSVRGSGVVTDYAYGVQQRSLVSRLVVEDGITSIGDKFTISSDSYTGFENISSVTFADSVEELPAGMLRDCSSLQKIDLPSGIKAIPDKFLYGCTSLGSVQIPDAVTKIGEESFYGCSSLQSVSFGSSVDTIGAESFAKCASLAAISLPKTVASIGEKAFSETGVVELVFPASVEEMDRSTFDKCPSLTKVVFEGAFPSLEGGSYSGNQIIGIHRANDETWQVRGKYNIGDITWYTENADGSLAEDDYVSPWPGKNLEIDAGYSGDMHSGSRDHYAYYFTVDEADLFEINWSVFPSDDSCVHWFFSYTLRSTVGNEGKEIDFWYADSKTADDGCRKMSLAPGGYVIEVYGLDSHSSSAGYAGVSVSHQKRDITDASIALGTDSYEYTGTAIAPKPEVYWGETALVEGVDYNLSYQSNVEPGRGMVIIRGLGRYSWSTAYLFFDIVRSAGNCIALPGHWATGSGGWWYPYDNGGYPANEWCIIDGSYYHFDGSGYMQTGWLNLGGTWYYLSSSGIMQTGWQKIGGSWYWFDDSGAMASGWRVVDGSYYYFDGSGAMQTGWLSTGGAWYYLSGSGAMATGWQTIGGERYHFDGLGAMASGWTVVDGSYYYFDGSGAMQTGWLNRGGAWYWLGDSGVMATGWQAIGGAKYWFDDSGAMATGWKWIDGSCYYFDGSGAMQADKWIDGSYVDSDGRWDQSA